MTNHYFFVKIKGGLNGHILPVRNACVSGRVPVSAFDQIEVFENLKPQVFIKVRIIDQKLVPDIQPLLALPAGEKRRKAAVDEEDLSAAFEFRQLGKSRKVCRRRFRVPS